MGISEIEQEEIAQLCQVEGEGMMAIWATQMVLLISLGTTICYENAGHGTVSGGVPSHRLLSEFCLGGRKRARPKFPGTTSHPQGWWESPFRATSRACK